MLYTIIATAASTATATSLTSMSLLNKGLFTTLLGLVGVFLVLTLFYVSIKLMQRPGKNDPQTKE